MSRIGRPVAMTLLGVAACLSESACNVETSEERTPSNMTDRLARDGARQVLAETYADEPRWTSLRASVASGDQASLEAAMLLYQAADGGAREMLASSLGEALKSASVRVLMLAKKNNVSLDSVCQGPDVDDDRFNTFERAVDELTERERALTEVSNSEVQVERGLCLVGLQQARIGLAQFFEIENGERCVVVGKPIDEPCAIQLATREILRQQGNQPYARFKATYLAEEREWSVMAIYEPELPGGHVFVLVSDDGRVLDYSLGR